MSFENLKATLFSQNMIIGRFIENRLLDTLKVSPVVFINGARQSGKSTLVLNNLNKIGRDGIDAIYITFDNPTQMAELLLHLMPFYLASKIPWY